MLPAARLSSRVVRLFSEPHAARPPALFIFCFARKLRKVIIWLGPGQRKFAHERFNLFLFPVSTPDKKLLLWPPPDPRSHSKAVRSVSWAHDSKTLLTASEDMSILMHDVSSPGAA